MGDGVDVKQINDNVTNQNWWVICPMGTEKPNYEATDFFFFFGRGKGVVVVFSLFGRQPKKEIETKLKLVSPNKDLKQM